MQYVVRRTIAELGALYELEPEIRDVFVEGVNDVIILEWYIRHRCTGCVYVKEIDAIDIPASLVKEYECDGGNRGRILVLAEELDKRLSGDARNCPTLVYDADCERVLGSLRSVDMLIPTYFACLEMYLFNATTFDKMISLVMMGCEVSAAQAIDTLARTLVRLWTIKTANKTLGLSMS